MIDSSKRTVRTTVACVVTAIACLSVSASDAATAEEKCESKKLKLSAVYASCRLKVDAKAVLKGEPGDYAKCEENLATTFGKAEAKAGPAVCPTENDQSAIAEVLDDATSEVTEQLVAPDAACPPGYRDRTPLQVLQDWLAAYGAQNVPLFLCNYHPSAHVIEDQGILVGYDDISTSFTSLWNLFNGVPPTVLQLDVFHDTARLLTSLDAGWIEIEDGVDTFEIRRGRIRQQTRHGRISFNGPPPE